VSVLYGTIAAGRGAFSACERSISFGGDAGSQSAAPNGSLPTSKHVDGSLCAPYLLQESKGVLLHPTVVEENILRTVGLRCAYAQNLQLLDVLIGVSVGITASAVKTPVNGPRLIWISAEWIDTPQQI
jgi:hypothetical protein